MPQRRQITAEQSPQVSGSETSCAQLGQYKGPGPGAGGNVVVIDNVDIASVGGANDGHNYFVVNLSKLTNRLIVRNSQLGGLPNSAHVHGINIGNNTMVSTIIQNCVFNFLNDSITGLSNTQAIVSGNTSFNTNSGGESVNLRGTGSMVYVGNFWDVPPTSLLKIVSN